MWRMINSQVVHPIGLSGKPHISPHSLPCDDLWTIFQQEEWTPNNIKWEWHFHITWLHILKLWEKFKVNGMAFHNSWWHNTPPILGYRKWGLINTSAKMLKICQTLFPHTPFSTPHKNLIIFFVFNMCIGPTNMIV